MILAAAVIKEFFDVLKGVPGKVDSVYNLAFLLKVGSFCDWVRIFNFLEILLMSNFLCKFLFLDL